MKDWNSLPQSVVSAGSLALFKSRLTSHVAPWLHSPSVWCPSQGLCRLIIQIQIQMMHCSTSRRSRSLCTGYRFGNGWQLWCTNALMVALRSTWQSSIIQASADVQEWDQLTVGSSTCRVRILVTGRSPSLQSTHLEQPTWCHPRLVSVILNIRENCRNHTCLFDYRGACDI